MAVVDGDDDVPAGAGPHHGDAGVLGRHQEAAVGVPDGRDHGVDHAAVADDRNAAALVGLGGASHCGHDPLAEGVVALRAGNRVPPPGARVFDPLGVAGGGPAAVLAPLPVAEVHFAEV